MIIKHKTPEQAKVYDQLFDVYESIGRYQALDLGMYYVRQRFISRDVLYALLEEIDMCYEIG